MRLFNVQAVYSRMWAGESKNLPLYNAINCYVFFFLSLEPVQHMSRQRKQRLRGTENVYFVVNLNKEMYFFNVLKVLYPLLEVTETFFFFFRYLLFSTLHLHPEHFRRSNNFTLHYIAFRRSVQNIKRSGNWVTVWTFSLEIVLWWHTDWGLRVSVLEWRWYTGDIQGFYVNFIEPIKVEHPVTKNIIHVTQKPD